MEHSGINALRSSSLISHTWWIRLCSQIFGRGLNVLSIQRQWSGGYAKVRELSVAIYLSGFTLLLSYCVGRVGDGWIASQGTKQGYPITSVDLMTILDQKILMCQSDLDLVKMFPISFGKKNEDGGGMQRLLYNYDMSLGVYTNIGGA